MSGDQVDQATQHDDGAGRHEDDPAIWGWHHTFGRGGRVAGWIVVLILLAMTIGNHEGHIEDLWLVALAGGMAAVLIRDIGKRRKSWRS